MYISKVFIKNYRNFKNFEIKLKPFTLIIGENNIGKTNLLNAIGLIFSQDITFFKKRMLEVDDINYKATQNFLKSVSEWDGESDLTFPNVRVEITLTGFNSEKINQELADCNTKEKAILQQKKVVLENQEATVSDWFIDSDFKEAKLIYHFGFRGDEKKWAKEYKGVDVKKIPFPIDKCDYSIHGGLDNSKRVDFYFLRMLKMELLDALRDAQRELVANNDSKLLYKILNDRDKNSFNEIKDTLNHLNEEVEKNEELKKVTKEISTLLKKISLEQYENQNKIGFKFSSLEHTEILKKLAIQYGDNPVSIARNGLGRNNVLFISIVLSHLTGEAIKAQNVFFRIIGLEEPEAHLHPHLQEHLAKNIETQANEEIQIILTSHSTHITSKLDLENTVVLYKHHESHEIKSHYILEGFEGFKYGKIEDNAQSIKHKRYLSRYLDATKSTLLFGRKMILVEGISEQILISRFFEIYTEQEGEKKSLESIGCTVVNVSSVAFSHFLELVKNSKTDSQNFFIKCLALTDSDSDTQKAERGSELKLKYDTVNAISVKVSEKSTFEKDVIEANRKGISKKILLNAIEKTRPINGKGYKTEYLDKDIDVESFFDLIEYNMINNKKKSHKADFATDLFDSLKEDETAIHFQIPLYIRTGFDFLK
jgi:putative ATP-dependent endonuclease of OLD family